MPCGITHQETDFERAQPQFYIHFFSICIFVRRYTHTTAPVVLEGNKDVEAEADTACLR